MTVTFNSVATSVFVDKSTNIPHVHLASGETLHADVVIGADGYQSIVRQVVSQKDDDGVDSGMSTITLVGICHMVGDRLDVHLCARITIPSELMKSDPELANLPDMPEVRVLVPDPRFLRTYVCLCFRHQWPLWMGTSRCALGLSILISYLRISADSFLSSRFPNSGSSPIMTIIFPACEHSPAHSAVEMNTT